MKAAKSQGEESFALQLKARGIAQGWERQYRFAPPRRWTFDFCHPQRWLAVEIEGGVWIKGGGRHNRGLTFERDLEKYNTATNMGFRVYRGTTAMAVDGRLAQVVEEAMRK